MLIVIGCGKGHCFETCAVFVLQCLGCERAKVGITYHVLLPLLVVTIELGYLGGLSGLDYDLLIVGLSNVSFKGS